MDPTGRPPLGTRAWVAIWAVVVALGMVVWLLDGSDRTLDSLVSDVFGATAAIALVWLATNPRGRRTPRARPSEQEEVDR